MDDIILTGPKHSGKTTTGRALALIYSREFIDLDELITQRTGKSPRQLFVEGQAVFQRAETEATAALFDTGGTSGKKRVIATGGGIIDNAEAVLLLKKTNAKIVYLNVSTENAWGRISARKELPLFLQTENPKESHRVLHERRSAAYLQLADIVIDAERKTSEEIAKEIFSRLP